MDDKSLRMDDLPPVQKGPERRVIMAMIIAATFLGVKSIHKNCLSDRSIVFGRIRDENSDHMIVSQTLASYFLVCCVVVYTHSS